jgi:hypothetical protein
MRRRWTLLGPVLGVLACFNSQPQSSSCDYKYTGPPLFSWGSGDSGASDPCTTAGGTCPYSEYCSPGTHADSSLWCAAGGFLCCAPDSPDASPDGANDASVEGLCNLVACAAGCTCEPAGGDAGGGACVCAEAGVDAGPDVVGDAAEDAATDGPVDASQDAPAASEAGDAAGLDSGGEGGGEGGASAACGVIQCAKECTCVDVQLSECACP